VWREILSVKEDRKEERMKAFWNMLVGLVAAGSVTWNIAVAVDSHNYQQSPHYAIYASTETEQRETTAPTTAVSPITMAFYVPDEQAQERLLARHGWTIFHLVAADLGISLTSLVHANNLRLSDVEKMAEEGLRIINPGTTIAVPLPSLHHSWVACASYYGLNDGTDGHVQADGSIFHANELSLASKELPKGSVVTVEFLETGVVVNHVVVKDSGPYVAECKRFAGEGVFVGTNSADNRPLTRSIDLSWGLMIAGFQGNAARAQAAGLTKVRITIESIPQHKLK